MSVVEPANCGTPAALTSKPLLGALYMDESESDLGLIPSSGAALFVLEITGTSCPIASDYKLDGSLYAQEENHTGVAAVTQDFLFSQTINEDAGGSLTTAGQPVSIAGELGVKLAAPNAGEKFESD
jgi:hypothetical protein